MAPRGAKTLKLCEHCGEMVGLQGMAKHQKTCKKRENDLLKAIDYQHEQLQAAEVQPSTSKPRTRSQMSLNPFMETYIPAIPAGSRRDPLVNQEIDPAYESEFGLPDGVLDQTPNVSLSVSDRPHLDEIKTEYHPNAKKPPSTRPFETPLHQIPVQEFDVPSDFEPWKPFRTRFDYEVLEFSLRAGLNKSLTNELIHLLQRCSSHNSDEFTIGSAAEMQKLWDLSAHKTSEFQKEKISVPYKEEAREFDVRFRPLWDWVEEIVSNKQLVQEMEWDAQQQTKFNGEKWEQFIKEPWTANSWWRIQSDLPMDSKPFFIILYADKNKLSTFGTQKGYPVIARCANLPSHIRNGTGVGGGRVVGWLPVVEGNSADSGKTSFANFKSAVWHKSFEKILDSLIPHSKTGCSVLCGDNTSRHLFPIPYILSADYEEQCVMALIRGFGGLCPCPKCLIPKDELADLSAKADLRTPQHTLEIMKKVESLKLQTEKEEVLKEHSLRPGQNAFLKLEHMDPYLGCSFDELHFDSSGLWEHLFEQFKCHLKEMARETAVAIDSRQVCLM
ncbi:hypothetical protein VKT23_017884 [Stygiomarasmius scandens]|uniref:Transposase n=1 Tax=Marasmiellus scandens TaxID=2682957 RepID=A0ABR1IQT5_9AGAR